MHSCSSIREHLIRILITDVPYRDMCIRPQQGRQHGGVRQGDLCVEQRTLWSLPAEPARAQVESLSLLIPDVCWMSAAACVEANGLRRVRLHNALADRAMELDEASRRRAVAHRDHQAVVIRPGRELPLALVQHHPSPAVATLRVWLMGAPCWAPKLLLQLCEITPWQTDTIRLHHSRSMVAARSCLVQRPEVREPPVDPYAVPHPWRQHAERSQQPCRQRVHATFRSIRLAGATSDISLNDPPGCAAILGSF